MRAGAGLEVGVCLSSPARTHYRGSGSEAIQEGRRRHPRHEVREEGKQGETGKEGR